MGNYFHEIEQNCKPKKQTFINFLQKPSIIVNNINISSMIHLIFKIPTSKGQIKRNLETSIFMKIVLRGIPIELNVWQFAVIWPSELNALIFYSYKCVHNSKRSGFFLIHYCDLVLRSLISLQLWIVQIFIRIFFNSSVGIHLDDN